jgi:hypothetical protein
MPAYFLSEHADRERSASIARRIEEVVPGLVKIARIEDIAMIACKPLSGDVPFPAWARIRLAHVCAEGEREIRLTTCNSLFRAHLMFQIVESGRLVRTLG